MLLEASAHSTVSMIEDWRDEILSGLEMEAKTIEYNDQWTRDEQRDYQGAMTEPNSAVPTGMYVGTPEKDMIDPSWEPDPGYDPTTRDWYRDGLNNAGFRFGEPYIDAETGLMVVTASRALRTPDGGIRGVAAGDVRMNSTSEIVAQVRIEQTGGAFLADSSTGIVIGAADSSVPGMTMSELGANTVYGQAAQWVTARAGGLHPGSAGGRTLYF